MGGLQNNTYTIRKEVWTALVKLNIKHLTTRVSATQYEEQKNTSTN